MHYHATKPHNKKGTKEGAFSVGGDGGTHLRCTTMAKPNHGFKSIHSLPHSKKDTKEGVFSVGGDGGIHLRCTTMAKPNQWVRINPPLPTQQKRVG